MKNKLLSSSHPQRNLVCCAKKAGLLLFQFPDHLELWRLGESNMQGELDHQSSPSSQELLKHRKKNLQFLYFWINVVAMMLTLQISFFLKSFHDSVVHVSWTWLILKMFLIKL